MWKKSRQDGENQQDGENTMENLEIELERVEDLVKIYEREKAERLERKENLERGERQNRKEKEEKLERKRKLEDYWKMIRCLVNSIDENQEQWDMDREQSREEESGELKTNIYQEIPSEAQLSQEQKIPEQEMREETKFGKTELGPSYHEQECVQNIIEDELNKNRRW